MVTNPLHISEGKVARITFRDNSSLVCIVRENDPLSKVLHVEFDEGVFSSIDYGRIKSASIWISKAR